MTSLCRQLPAILFALCAAGPLAAEYGDLVVQSDLDGDGQMERFEIIDPENDGLVDLRITQKGKPTILARDVAWKGGIGQEPYLDLAPNGSVQLISLNESIGRNRWFQTLTIAYRNGTYRVAGFTYQWYDTLNLEDNGICDLNLLTGTGNLRVNEDPQKLLRTDLPALPVTEWTEDLPFPKACDIF